MELLNFYKIVKEKIELGDYEIKKISSDVQIQEINSHIETIHYLMAKYMKDNKDKRFKNIFKYVCVPSVDIEIDFSNLNFKIFMLGLVELKS